MSGNRGLKIRPQVKKLIVGTALESSEARGPLAMKLYDLISKMPGKSMPETETIEKLISWARNHVDPEGGPWSLGASEGGNVPPEATKSLLNIWWWCRVVGRSFTIREAKWVVRFWGVVPYEELLYWASLYALRERVSELLEPGSAAYTDDLDSLLELQVILEESDGMGPLSFAALVTQTIATSAIGKAMEKGMYPIPEKTTDSMRERIAQFIGWRDGDREWLKYPAGPAVEHLLNLACNHVEFLPAHGDAIYAMWLRKFSSGPEWPLMSQEVRLGVAQRLHVEVADWWNRRQEAHEAEFPGPPYTKSMEWYVGHNLYWPSEELLDVVGMGQEQRREDSHERPSGQAKSRKLEYRPGPGPRPD